MFRSKSLLWNSLLLLALFAIGILVGVYSPVSKLTERTRFPAWEQSLALGSTRFVFLPLNNPDAVPAAMASHMDADDLVAGIVVKEQPRAYPYWILVGYHVVNDTIKDSPVFLAYCEICSSASAFRPEVDRFKGKSLAFQIYGIANGTFSVYDYQTRSVWSPFTGKTLEGELHPSGMARIPLIIERWGDWVTRYPQTEVVFATTKVKEREHGHGERNEVGASYLPAGFAKTANTSDRRLALNTLVFGIASPKSAKAIVFPLEFLERQQDLLKHQFDNEYYLIRKIGKFGVVAFRLQKGQEEREYHQISDRPFRIGDNQGGIWNEVGKAVNETGEKRDLAAADGYFAEWYEWVSAHPGSEIAR